MKGAMKRTTVEVLGRAGLLVLGWLALHLRRRLRRKVGLRALPVEIAPPVKTGS